MINDVLRSNFKDNNNKKFCQIDNSSRLVSIDRLVNAYARMTYHFMHRWNYILYT